MAHPANVDGLIIILIPNNQLVLMWRSFFAAIYRSIYLSIRLTD